MSIVRYPDILQSLTVRRAQFVAVDPQYRSAVAPSSTYVNTSRENAAHGYRVNVSHRRIVDLTWTVIIAISYNLL